MSGRVEASRKVATQFRMLPCRAALMVVLSKRRTTAWGTRPRSVTEVTGWSLPSSETLKSLAVRPLSRTPFAAARTSRVTGSWAGSAATARVKMLNARRKDDIIGALLFHRRGDGGEKRGDYERIGWDVAGVW